MIVVLIFGRRVMVKSACCDSNVTCLDVRERVVYPKIEVTMKMKGKEFPQKRSRSFMPRDLMDIVPCSLRNALKSNSGKNQEQRSHFDCYHYTGSQPSFSG